MADYDDRQSPSWSAGEAVGTMATKVLDLEIEAIPPSIGDLSGYTWALVLFRYRSVPVGKAYVPVVNGRISQFELSAALTNLGWPLWQAKLQEYLAWDEHAENDIPHVATVAVCTRDRPDDLRRCLEAFLRLPDDGQEFLVIDYAPSSDATQILVESYNGRMRYVREDRPGLDIARNRALQEARYDIVAFNDDDALPDPNWLRVLLRNFADPLVVCVTGLTMPIELETEAQEWFERCSSFVRGFTRTVYDQTRLHPLAAGKVGAGANMALRRSVMDLVGPFDEALDAGTPTQSGGDTEMFFRILAAGYRIVYEPTAISWHRHRRTWEALRRALYGYGVGVYATWTRNLLYDREFAVFLRALAWLRYDQLPNFIRAILLKPNHIPMDLLLAEWQGCLAGPLAYFKSKKSVSQTTT